MDEHIRAERDGGLLTITLNRPEALNAMTMPMGRRLKDELTLAARDPRVRAILITGEGRAFCSGGDVKQRGSADPGDPLAEELGDDPVWNSAELRVARMIDGARTYHLLQTLPKPTIAMINGLAIGAGAMLAMACDIRFMSDQAYINTFYSGSALSGTSGMAWLLTAAVGASRARELMFFPRRIPAGEALALGLVHRAVPHKCLREETLAAARQLADGATLALGHMKENLRAAATLGPEAAFEMEARNYVRCLETDDYAEAMAAFREKRAPAFKGR